MRTLASIWRIICGLASLLFLLCPLPAVAQRERGEVRVEVRDPVGMGVAASGEILSQGNEFRRSFQIGNDGTKWNPCAC